MSKVKFIFCAHNHQPVGNFGWVFEKAYQAAYKPFMQVMLAHPKIKWSMHASGMLWEFFTKEHGDYIKNIKKLVSNGNLEILAGGYGEPIMSAIPDRDKIGQIKKMVSYVKNKFGCQEAEGIWLAERVWEPSLAKILCESGIKYTVLDDAHFIAAGIETDSLNGYYTTEEQGYSLNVFPISQKLRYMIPFQDVEKPIEYFRTLSNSGILNPTVVMADDGEKFGMWPGTNRHVYENGWLEKFLTALEENANIVETASFSSVQKTQKSSGRAYLPCSSYFEMSEWTLPSDEQAKFDEVLRRYGGDEQAKTFLRGGFWKNFLSKYEESNNMHKKMLYVSQKVKKYTEIKKDDSCKAVDNLYYGQCNCAYWHGVFGGLYLPHLRNAVYESLLKAENDCNKSLLKRAGWTVADFDCDMENEYLYESKTHNIYVSPSKGGTIFEFDLLKINRNFSDVLTRRREAYHKALEENIGNAVVANDNEREAHTIHGNGVKVKEAGLDKYLRFDSSRKVSLADHFIRRDVARDDFAFAKYEELGDFVCAPYKAELKGLKLILEREGKVFSQNVRLKKVIIPAQDGYVAEYEIANVSLQNLEFCFAPEFVFAFSSKTKDDGAQLKCAEVFKRYDEYLKIELEAKLSESCDVFVYPLETVSNSENGYEKTYQGTSFVPLLKCALPEGETKKFSVEIKINYNKN